MSILVINCGSSSIKLDIVDPDDGVRILKMRAIRLGSPGCTLKINGKITSCPNMDMETMLNLALDQIILLQGK